MNLEHSDELSEAARDSALSIHDFRAIFAATPGVNLLLAAQSPTFTMLLASDERLTATMTTREATLGRPLFEVFPDANPENPEPSGVENLRSSLETVLRTRAPHRMQLQRYDLRRVDGSWEERYWSPLNVPVLGPDGQVRFLLHHVTDVTEQVLGQRALARAEQRAARILDRMADAHCILDSELRVIAMNPAAERMTGRTCKEVLGLGHWDAFPDSFDPDTGEAYRRVVDEGVEQHLQQHYVTEGRDIHLEIDAYSTDEGGVAIFARDVSERVRGVEARRKSEAQRFLTQLGDALHSLSDASAVQREATRLLAEQLGASRVVYADTDDASDEICVIAADHRREPLAPLAGLHRFDAYGPCVTKAFRAKEILAVADLRDVQEIDANQRGTHEAAGIRACVAVPILREGRVAACLAVMQSTPRTWAAHDIALVEETAERACVAIARARAESALRDSDRRKDEFLATLAHELRNPLAPVRNGLQILRMAADDPDTTARTLGVMERQLSHMARLIDDLLDVSRITRGKVTLQRERLALRALLDSAVEASRHLIEASGHALTLHLPYEPLYLDADATRLAQVIGNLINNAAKYTPDGGRIDIHAERQDREIVLRVEDNGVGIPDGMQSHVFDMFAQVGGNSLERAHGGLGIGLSISRQLVQMHGGSIHAKSPGPGLGSVFTVRLPLAAETSAGMTSAPLTGQARAIEARRVLVVDDNVDAADSFATMLGLFGHEVCTTYSGTDALAAARDFRPSFIFCDIGMPGLNGYEVAQRLRADSTLAPVRLVAVTGWGSEDDRRRALESGFDLHLAKPVDWVVVQAVLADGS